MLLLLFLASTAQAQWVDTGIIQNGSFEANPAPAWPGYTGSMSNWSLPGTGYFINSDAVQAFYVAADNGPVPNGLNVSGKQGPGTMSQTLSGLVDGRFYRLDFYTNLRNCCAGGQMGFRVYLGTQVLFQQNSIPVTNPFQFHQVQFIYSSTWGNTLTLEFYNAVSDSSVVIDDFRLYTPTTYTVGYTPSPGFGGSVTGPGTISQSGLPGDSITVQVTPNTGFGIGTVSASNGTITPAGGNNYTLSGVGANTTVTATFTNLAAPTVTNVTVIGARQVDVTFSEAVFTGSTTAANYALSGSGKGSLSTNPNSVVPQPNETYRLSWTGDEMFDGGDITVTVSNVQDIGGLTVGSPNSGTDAGAAIGTDPTVTCPGSASVNTDAGVCTGTVPNIIGSLGAGDVNDNVSSDTALLASLQQSPAAGTPGVNDGQVITVTVADEAGNSSQCTVTLTVNDNEDPVVTCPATASVNADAGVCTGTVPDLISGLGAADVSDNCTSDGNLLASLQQSPAAGTPGVSDGQVITISVTDDASNVGQCTVTLDVVDNQNPTVSCIASATVNVDPGTCTGTVPDVISGITAADVSDNCTSDAALLASLQQSPAAGTPGVGDGQVITVSVVDGAANVGQCTVTLDVVDNEDPTLSNPGTQNLSATPGTCSVAMPDVTGLVGAADNCSLDTVVQSVPQGTGLSLGSTTSVTVTATDASGNSADVSFDVVVAPDTEQPTLSNPGTQNLSVGAGLCTVAMPDYTGSVAAADNCVVGSVNQSVAPGTALAAGSTKSVTVTVTDTSNNTNDVTFDVVVAGDAEDPALSNPGTQNLSATPGTCSVAMPDVTGLVGAADNCGVDSVTQSVAQGTALNPGSTTSVTVTATDAAGNSGGVTFDVVVAPDTEDPVVTPNAGATASVAIGALFTDPGATASDNCGVAGGTAIAAGTCIAGDCSYDTSTPGNTWTIEYSASDVNGNGPVTATTVFNVVDDTTPPQFTNLAVTPEEAAPGQTVTIMFTSSEELLNEPEVLLNGNAATFVAQGPTKAAVAYTYEYTVAETDVAGPVEIVISGSDLAGNLGAVSNSALLAFVETAAGLPLAAWPLALLLGLSAAATLRRRR